MHTTLDMTKVFLSSTYFRLLPTDVAWEIFFFCLCRVIALAFWGGGGAGRRHNGCNFFIIHCNG